MTICIAAISEGNKIVSVTDKMLTISASPVTKYEINENNKAIQLNPRTIGLFSGDVVTANQILTLSMTKISPDDTVNCIAEKVNDSYKEYMHSVFDNYLVRKYGLGFTTFMSNHSNLDADLVKTVSKLFADTNFDVQIIVAGIDENPHIYYLDSTGTIVNRDSIGYTCIGSGSQHAILSMVESQYHGNIKLDDAIFALLQAKTRAEYDPGVGKLWDFVLIDGETTRPSLEKVEKIAKKYEISRSKMKKIASSCAKDIIKIIKDD